MNFQFTQMKCPFDMLMDVVPIKADSLQWIHNDEVGRFEIDGWKVVELEAQPEPEKEESKPEKKDTKPKEEKKGGK